MSGLLFPLGGEAALNLGSLMENPMQMLTDPTMRQLLSSGGGGGGGGGVAGARLIIEFVNKTFFYNGKGGLVKMLRGRGGEVRS